VGHWNLRRLLVDIEGYRDQREGSEVLYGHNGLITTSEDSRPNIQNSSRLQLRDTAVSGVLSVKTSSGFELLPTSVKWGQVLVLPILGCSVEAPYSI
jgi:hypothetical protein